MKTKRLSKRIVVAALGLGALAACVEKKPLLHGGEVNSIAVQLVSPAADSLGSPSKPVELHEATVNIIARDELGQTVARDLTVEIYISFGGIKTGMETDCGADVDGTPIETVLVPGGVLLNHTIPLPDAYGSTAIWIDDPASGATGASPTIYFRNAHISEAQTPDFDQPNFTYCSKFNNKFLVFDRATAGGQLVVTSVFGNAFAITDTGVPLEAGKTNFASIYLYAFGKPPPYIVEGRVLKSFSGNYSKFVGFTELNFPLFDVDMDAPLAAVPAPIELTVSDIADPGKMLGAAASVITYTGTVCDPLPPNPDHNSNIQKTIDSWNIYNQFVLGSNSGLSCDSFNNMAVQLPAKQLGGFNPLQHVGATVTMVGMLQNHSGQNPVLDGSNNTVACSDDNPCVRGTCLSGICYKGAYNFWTLMPRRPEDVISVSQ